MARVPSVADRVVVRFPIATKQAASADRKMRFYTDTLQVLVKELEIVDRRVPGWSETGRFVEFLAKHPQACQLLQTVVLRLHLSSQALQGLHCLSGMIALRSLTLS